MQKKNFLYILFTVLAIGHISTACSQEEISIKDIANRYKMSIPSKNGKNITITNKSSKMVFEADSRKLLFNNLLIWMNEPLTKKGNNFLIAQNDILSTIAPLLSEKVQKKTIIVVLDPGHGGKDTGARGKRKVLEKKVVLDIAKRVNEKLESSGLEVKMTRTQDKSLTLKERSELAKNFNADLFISIHINSAQNLLASGIETYIIPAHGSDSTAGGPSDKNPLPGNKFDNTNMLLAYYIQKGVLSQTSANDRGIKRARFEVLKYAPCPAILLECGFVSNTEEETKFIDNEYRDLIAEGIAHGILTYTSKVSK